VHPKEVVPAEDRKKLQLKAILMTNSRRIIALALVLTAATLFALPHAFAQPSAAHEVHRLILKDGSYQEVSKYEVKGDRVRYMSAERDEWEELPTSLVDWPATEKYEKERSAPSVPEAAELDRQFKSEQKAEQDVDLPEVAPGLHLPELAGMYMLDNFKGQPQLVEVQQSEGDVNRNTKTNILRGAIPAAGVKQTIELDGEHASVYSHVSVPSIYISADDDAPPPGETDSAKMSKPSLDAPRSAQPEQPQQPQQASVPFDRYLLIRLKTKSGKRIVGDIKRSANGKTSQQEDSVKTTIDKVAGDWLKLTPTEDLAPGEYAVIEMKGKEGMNLYVWPFSVNPNAPKNANPWTPEEKKSAAPPQK
jgi:hypothetical protein